MGPPGDQTFRGSRMTPSKPENSLDLTNYFSIGAIFLTHLVPPVHPRNQDLSVIPWFPRFLQPCDRGSAEEIGPAHTAPGGAVRCGGGRIPTLSTCCERAKCDRTRKLFYVK